MELKPDHPPRTRHARGDGEAEEVGKTLSTSVQVGDLLPWSVMVARGRYTTLYADLFRTDTCIYTARSI